MTDPVESLARKTAVEAHAGQVDKAGEPYIGHVERVVARLSDPLDRAVGWLHDVPEDCSEWSLSALLHRGQEEFGARGKLAQQWVDVLACVRALTHRPNEPREQYYIRVQAAGPRAVRVKLADVADNSDPARLGMLDEETRERLTVKYRKAREALEALEGER